MLIHFAGYLHGGRERRKFDPKLCLIFLIEHLICKETGASLNGRVGMPTTDASARKELNQHEHEMDRYVDVLI